MRIAILKEQLENEMRVAITPSSIKKLQALGFDLAIEKDAGKKAGFHDSDYEKLGVKILARKELLQCDIILTLNIPSDKDIISMKTQSVLIGPLGMANNVNLLAKFTQRNIIAFFLDQMARDSLCLNILDSIAYTLSKQAFYQAFQAFNEEIGDFSFPLNTNPKKILIIGGDLAALSLAKLSKEHHAHVCVFSADNQQSFKSLEVEHISLSSIQITPLLEQRLKEASIIFATQDSIMLDWIHFNGINPYSLILDLQGSIHPQYKKHKNIKILNASTLKSPQQASELHAQSIISLLENIIQTHHNQPTINFHNPITPNTFFTPPNTLESTQLEPTISNPKKLCPCIQYGLPIFSLLLLTWITTKAGESFVQQIYLIVVASFLGISYTQIRSIPFSTHINTTLTGIFFMSYFPIGGFLNTLLLIVLAIMMIIHFTQINTKESYEYY